MSDQLSAPVTLTAARQHLLTALIELGAVSWHRHLPDMCCDDDRYPGTSHLEPANAEDVTSTLLSVWLRRATRLGPLLNFAPDNDPRSAWFEMRRVLRLALVPDPAAQRADGDTALLSWAASLPIQTGVVLEHMRAELIAPWANIGMRCEPTDPRTAALLNTSRTETVAVRGFTDDELETLTAAPVISEPTSP